jgi:hypothetical protein
MKTTRISNINACALGCALAFTATIAQAADLVGIVQYAGKPIAEATVTLYAAGAEAPTQLAQGKANDDGAFTLTYTDAPAESVLYVVAKGGTPRAAADKGPNDAIALMALLGTQLPKTVTINELTTVASTFTAARRPSRLIYPTRRQTSPFHFGLAAAGLTPMATWFSIPRVTCGAA